MVLKKPLKKIVAIMAMAKVTRAMEKYTKEYWSPFIMAEVMAVGAKFKPITMITEPITTGGKALSNHFVPASRTIPATTA